MVAEGERSVKIKAIEEQGYYFLNGMAITTGNVYEGVPHSRPFAGGGALVVVGDDGGKVFMLPDEYELVSDERD